MGLVVIATRPTLISGHHRTDTSEDDEQLEADLRLAIANQIRDPLAIGPRPSSVNTLGESWFRNAEAQEARTGCRRTCLATLSITGSEQTRRGLVPKRGRSALYPDSRVRRVKSGLIGRLSFEDGRPDEDIDSLRWSEEERCSVFAGFVRSRRVVSHPTGARLAGRSLSETTTRDLTVLTNPAKTEQALLL